MDDKHIGATLNDLQSHGPYPMTRAFVVKLHRDADLARGALRGRIEHVASGQRGEFDGTGQLLGWLAGGLHWESEEARRTYDVAPQADASATPFDGGR